MKFAALHLVSGPDIQAARRLHDCQRLDDEDSSHILFHQHGWDPKSSFRFGDDAVHLPFFLQHIAAAALVVFDGDKMELKVIQASGEGGESQLLLDLNHQLSKLPENITVFAWNGADQVLPLLSARRALLGVRLPLPDTIRSLAPDYLQTQSDSDERQLDYIATLHGLAPSSRPLNVSADQAGRQLAQQHANIRAWQLAFLATRQQQVSGQRSLESSRQIEAKIRQQLTQVAPPQDNS
jgi:hypothetical protein